MLVGLLVTCLVLTSTTTVHGQALTPPAWVPQTVNGWTLAYNNSTELGFNIGGDHVVSNWTQIWIKNNSNTVESVVGVVNFEYDKDYFSQAIPSTVKAIISLAGAGGLGLPAFNGSTMWDVMKWAVQGIGINGDNYADETGKITGATGAFSLNITVGGSNFYLLFAYRNQYAMMIFAISVDQTITTSMATNNWLALKTLFNNFANLIVVAFGILTNAIVFLATFDPNLGAAPTTAGNIVPTVANPSTPQDVNSFANSYIPLFPGGIPGYPVLLIGIASFFTVFVIVQKKRKAIAA